MTQTKPTENFRCVPSARQLANRLKEVRRKYATANLVNDKEYNAIRKQMAEALASTAAVTADGKGTLSFVVPKKFMTNADVLNKLNAWIKDAGIATPQIGVETDTGVTLILTF